MATKTPISTSEAAKILGVTSRTVIRLVERGEISGWRVGEVWRFNREDIEEYKRQQTRGKQSEQN